MPLRQILLFRGKEWLRVTDNKCSAFWGCYRAIDRHRNSKTKTEISHVRYTQLSLLQEGLKRAFFLADPLWRGADPWGNTGAFTSLAAARGRSEAAGWPE